MQRLPSLINFLQSKEDVELFQMHSMKELVVQDDHNYDHINVKVIYLNGVHLLRFINNVIFFCFLHLVESVDEIVCIKVNLKIS